MVQKKMKKTSKAQKKSAYARAGVDIAKADRFVDTISKMVKTTLNERIVKSIGGYASLYKLSEDEFLAATTDGVGTKLKLAFEMKRHDTVGIDLVAMSVNDLVCVGARPLFFLDYFATGRLDLTAAQAVLKGIVEGCKRGRLALTGGETAEMPGLYQDGEYDLAGFAVGLVSRDRLIDGQRVRTGDVLLGLESSGPHSNGFSLIRKILSESKPVNLTNKKLMQACLEPTRIYVDPVQTLQSEIGLQLKGLAHITGSGFLNIPRINSEYDYEIELHETFEMPEVFLELKERGDLSWAEMYTTFNMGIGLVAAIEPMLAVRAQNLLERAGVRSVVIGKVGKKTKNSMVNITGPDYKISLKY